MCKILFIVFLGYTLPAWSQGSGHKAGNKTASPNDKWNEYNYHYIWSQTHPAPAKADKPIMDFKAIDNWPMLMLERDVAISNDGQYFAYTVRNALSNPNSDSLVIQSTHNKWRQSFGNARAGFFSANNKLYIFSSKDGKNLFLLQTGTGHLNTIKDIVSYQQDDKGTWLALQQNSGTVVLKNLVSGKDQHFDDILEYAFDKTQQWFVLQLKNESKELILYNLQKNNKLLFKNVLGYTFDGQGKVLVLKTMATNGGNQVLNLQYHTLKDGASETIWSAPDEKSNLGAFVMDGSGRQLAFIVQTAQGNAAWYWKQGMKNAVLKLDEQNKNVVEPGYFMQDVFFVKGDRYFFCKLQQREQQRGKPLPGAIQVDVWSYRDTFIQSYQPLVLQSSGPKSYLAVAPAEGSFVFRLDKGKPFEYAKRWFSDYAIVAKSGRQIHGDRFWEKGYDIDSNWLVSLKDGSRTLMHTATQEDIWFSPGGNYAVYFEPDEGSYFSYDLRTKKLVNISMRMLDRSFWKNYGLNISAGITSWLNDDAGLLVYDSYGDIWQLDLAGKKTPVNITNGYAKRNHVKFLVNGGGAFFETGIEKGNSLVLPVNTTLLLKSYNIITRQNGVFLKKIGTMGDPEHLFSGQYSFAMLPGTMENLAVVVNEDERRAADANAWIIKRESCTEFPNYFLTKDFKSYTPLTNYQPQRQYNWLTGELHRFRTMNGYFSSGALFKPENFDPLKKYPVIINLYERPSFLLSRFSEVRYVGAPVAEKNNPSWMVSRGYLVFLADIDHYERGETGRSALYAVEGAVNYLRSLPFVDGNKLGLSGHSRSGGLMYYILTHSHSFAAIAAGAGGTDVVSSAFSLNHLGESNLQGAVRGRGTLWQNKEQWLSGSSIMSADRVSSPFLMFYNFDDVGGTTQPLEMFTALRSLGKKGWWLQYDKGGHALWGDKAKDFTIRYTQFFDHYLKGAPAPRWMTEGIPYALKGIDAKYELDPTGSCGKDCQVCANRAY